MQRRKTSSWSYIATSPVLTPGSLQNIMNRGLFLTNIEFIQLKPVTVFLHKTTGPSVSAFDSHQNPVN